MGLGKTFTVIACCAAVLLSNNALALGQGGFVPNSFSKTNPNGKTVPGNPQSVYTNCIPFYNQGYQYGWSCDTKLKSAGKPPGLTYIQKLYQNAINARKHGAYSFTENDKGNDTYEGVNAKGQYVTGSISQNGTIITHVTSLTIGITSTHILTPQQAYTYFGF